MAFDEDLHPQDELRRANLVRLLSIGALTMTPFGVLRPAWWGGSPDKLADNKSIFTLNGDVTVNSRKANLETRISAGDVVATGKSSEIVFVVGSDSFILRSNSLMEIEGSNFFVNTMRLLSGAVLSVFGERKNGQGLTMSSATATIGIRGTGVYMEAEPDLTYLCTCYGRVKLASSADPNDAETVVAEHHDAPKYITNKASKGTRIQPAPFINHTDIELKLLEAIVGREVPFGLEPESYKGERREY